ncbi:MAG TPA: polysaccharide biosynthesis tyrosine autokinase [Lacipirellula sp.]
MDYQPAPYPGHGSLDLSGRFRSRVPRRRSRRFSGAELEGEFVALPAPPVSRPRPLGEISLSQVLAALWRRKMLIIGSMLFLGFVGLVISQQFTPKYLSQGIMAIDARPTYLPQLGNTMAPFAPDSAAVRSEAQILTSRELIEDVARKLSLDKNPEFNPELQEPTLFEAVFGGLTKSVAAVARVFSSRDRKIDPETAAALAEQQMWSNVVSNVANNLDVFTDGKSYVIYVNFQSESPQTSAAVVNAIMETFLANQVEYAAKRSMQTNAWIKQRAKDLKAEVEEADQKVQEFRSKHGLLETRGGTVGSQQLNELNTQLSLARADRTQAEARLRAAQAVSKGGAVGDSTMEVLASPLIQRLREREAEAAQRLSEAASRLGPQHPRYRAAETELASIRGQIRREINKVQQSLQNQVDVARSRERNLEQQVAAIKGREMKVAAAEMELQQLQQEADTKRNVYQEFLATAQQTAEPSRTGLTTARIVSQAVPPVRPYGMSGKLYAAMGMFIGFLLAAASVLVFAERRRGFESADEAEDYLGVPVLGVLPTIGSFLKREGVLTQEVKENPSSSTAETLRGIRVAMRNRRADERNPQVILVTSALPGEGKTSFVGALGVVAAMDGARVLVVDSDIRRPRLRRMFCRNGVPKLSDVLRGEEPLSAAVYRDKKYHVDCLIASGTDHSPASLAMSGHWQSFLDEARKSYDLVLLDSSPVLKVADALCLADYADAVLMVVQYRVTSRRAVREALRRVLATRGPLAGLVMSRAKVAKTETQPYYSGYAA